MAGDPHRSEAALALQEKVLNLREIFMTISINAKPTLAMSLTALNFCLSFISF
jgi:hypothetical protein